MLLIGIEITTSKQQHEIDLVDVMLTACQRHAKIMYDKYSDIMPFGTNMEKLLCGLNSSVPHEGDYWWSTCWLSTKSDIVNTITPQWNTVIKHGIPSGKQIDDMLMLLRQKLWDKEKNNNVARPKILTPSTSGSASVESGASTSSTQLLRKDDDDFLRTNVDVILVEKQNKKAGRKSVNKAEYREFNPTWFPLSWLAWIATGPLSDNPFAPFCHVPSTGPKGNSIIKQEDVRDEVIATGRAEARAKERGNKRKLDEDGEYINLVDEDVTVKEWKKSNEISFLQREDMRKTTLLSNLRWRFEQTKDEIKKEEIMKKIEEVEQAFF